MSSRAFRRLNRDVDVIRISENAEEEGEAEKGPGFTSLACKKKGPVSNPFALVRILATITARWFMCDIFYFSSMIVMVWMVGVIMKKRCRRWCLQRYVNMYIAIMFPL